MKIQVISKWFNEEDLAPFFLDHYSYADEILILLDEGTNDNTVEIINRYPNATILWSKSTGKMDDQILIDELNTIVATLDSDWLILVDSDEFIFPQDFGDPLKVLSEADGNVIYAAMWQVYKNEIERKLNYAVPLLLQRRHGDPNRTEGINALYTKPIIVDPKIGIKWGVGNHQIEANDKVIISTTRFDGAHCAKIDENISIKRIIKGRKDRFSDREKEQGWGGQHFNTTEEDIRADFELHKNDPRLY